MTLLLTIINIGTAAAAVVAVVIVRGPLDWRGCPKGCAVTSAPPFSLHLWEPPTTGSHHQKRQKCLVVLTQFQRIPGTSVPECVNLPLIWDKLICLEAQAVTAADLGQEHGILACLHFSLLLWLVNLLVDQCSSRVLGQHICS